MNKTLTVLGNRGTNDMFGSLEYCINIINELASMNIELNIKWNYFDQVMSKYISFNNLITTCNIPIEELRNSKTHLDVHYSGKTSNPTLSFNVKELMSNPKPIFTNLFNRYDSISFTDQRAISRQFPTVNLLNYIKFSPEVVEEVNNAKLKLGPNYIAFHRRYTDISYTEKELNELENELNLHVKKNSNNILLLTDNQNLIKKYISNPKVFNFSYIKYLQEQNVELDSTKGSHAFYQHESLKNSITHQLNMQKSTFVDFLLGVYSSKLFISKGGYGQFMKMCNLFYNNNVLCNT